MKKSNIIFLFLAILFEQPQFCPAQISGDVNKSICADSVYSFHPIESVTTGTYVWQDNRHRAAHFPAVSHIYGKLLFDISTLPDNSTIISLNLRCFLEDEAGSPYNTPLVDIYWYHNDNWDRRTAQPEVLDLSTLLINNVLFTNYIPYYDFNLDVYAHDWSIDLLDNRITLVFVSDVTFQTNYVYFFGAYGEPVGPPPELTVTLASSSQQDILVELTPINPPIIIPPTGGTFQYTLLVANLGPTYAYFNLWTSMLLPSGNLYEPLLLRVLRMAPGDSIMRTLSQTIPGAAPAGNYTFYANVGVYPDPIWNFDSFPFSKSGQVGDRISANEADLWEGDQVVGNMSAQEGYKNLKAFPNPFNSKTKLIFDLDEPQMVGLQIYDITGREVFRSNEEWYNSGRNEIYFEAGDLANGIYIAHLNRESGGPRCCKLLLIK